MKFVQFLYMGDGGKQMKNKLIGIFLCMLLLATALPATGTLNEKTVTSTGGFDSIPILEFEVKISMSPIATTFPCPNSVNAAITCYFSSSFVHLSDVLL